MHLTIRTLGACLLLAMSVSIHAQSLDIIAPERWGETKQLEIPVSEELTYTVDLYEQDHTHPGANVRVYHGTTHDPAWAHLSHYRDVVAAVDLTTGRVVMHLFPSEGAFSVFPESGDRYRVERETEWDCGSEVHSHTTGEDNFFTPEAVARMNSNSCQEIDANGDYVMDIMMAFGHVAIAEYPDIEAYSAAQVETVNMGLNNTMVENLRMRLVYIDRADIHVGIVSSGISTFRDHFANEMIAAGADFIASYDSKKAGVTNYGGWGSTGGNGSLNLAGSATVFRHEWGHNSGSSHCNDGTDPSYRFGYDNGGTGTRTHMCGNDINFYSNPDLTDVNGNPIGDATTADNHRSITERRERYANYAPHVFPYDATDVPADCPATITQGRYRIKNVATGNYLSPISTTSRGHYILQEATPGTNQEWDLIHRQADRYHIRLGVNDGLALDVFGNSGSAGYNVGLWSESSGANQQWAVVPVGNGNYYLQPQNNDLCLQTPDGQSADGDEIHQDVCDGSTRSEWILEPVTGANPITLSTTVNNVGCTTNGSASVTIGNATGATYLWSDPAAQTTATATNLEVGNYTVTITEAGESYFASVTVRGTLPLQLEFSTVDAATGAPGSATVDQVLNATGAVSYTWSNGATGATASNLPGGIYTVTATDANGCSKVAEVEVFDGFQDNTAFVIEHVASGMYLAPANGSSSGSPFISLTDCPTDDNAARWTAERKYANHFSFENGNNSGQYLSVRSHPDIGDSVRLSSVTDSHHRWRMERVSADTWRMTSANNAHGLTVNGPDFYGAHLRQTDASQTNDIFRFIPIVATSPAAGTACDDSNNGTDDDLINLIGTCCGQRNECFDAGDVDGDRICADVDCDDNDNTIQPGAVCDDNDPNTISDAYVPAPGCDCSGRPTTCTETGTDLANVATYGIADSRNTLSSSPSPEVLNDGIIDGNYNNGTVWHSGGNYSWAEVALLQGEQIKEITLYPRTNCCPRLNGLTVLVSTTPFTSDGLDDMKTQSVFWETITAADDDSAPRTISVGEFGQYVRVKAGNSAMNLTEIEVRTCPQMAQLVLPVEFSRFYGEAREAGNHLTWTTATERNNAGFFVQRSDDGRSFTDLRWVPGAGDSEVALDYDYLDRLTGSGTHYYRLRQLDHDGTESLSQIVSLRRTGSAPAWTAQPNPVDAERLVTIGSLDAEAAHFELLDLHGRTVQVFAPGNLRLNVADLAAGVYFLRNRPDGGVLRLVL